MLALYILAEMNRPKPVEWEMTLSKEDKNPYGAYIVYRQLKDLFPQANIHSYRLPVYNQVNNFDDVNTAYFLICPQLNISREDVTELLDYVVSGNYVFMASDNFSKALMDSLKFRVTRRFELVNRDSVTINFVNPLLRAKDNYSFKQMTIDGYINKLDTANSLVLGTNQLQDANFIKMPYGEGAFFIHASPLCFSNYFMLTDKNADYVSKALSYLPQDVNKIFWDEYYKLGPDGSQNPLRFFLNNPFLKWAFRIGVAAMVLYVLFSMKRRQRIIPVITPLGNSTLDFVQTVGNVYFNQRDNKNIAQKKISYFLTDLRSDFFLSTHQLNEEFVEALSKKSGLDKQDVDELINLIRAINESGEVSDETLLHLNQLIDNFYSRV